MLEQRKTQILEAIQDLIASNTWKPDSEDLDFAVGYVSSFVRQVSGKSLDEHERGFVIMKLLDHCGVK